MNKIDKKLLNKKLNIKKLVKHLHIPIRDENSKEIWAQCPLGHQRRRASWSINHDKHDKHFGVFHCFSCGWKGNWLTLVKELLDMDTDEALEYVKALFGIGEITEDVLYSIALEDKKLAREAEQSQAKIVKYEMPKDFIRITEKNNSYCKYLINRGIALDTVLNNSIMYCDKVTDKYLKRYQKRIIIPITMNGVIASFFGRSILSKEEIEENDIKKGLYPPSPPASPMRLILYGWDEIDDSLDYGILVEGSLDKLKLQTLRYKNVMAALGNQLSKEKKEMIAKRFNGKRLFVIPDGDEGGEKLKEHCKDLVYDCKVYHIQLPEGNDPCDVNTVVLKQCIINRKKLYEKEVKLQVKYTIRK